MEGSVISVAVVTMLIPLAAVIGGLIVGALAIRQRTRLRELAYRERLAMIEKGMVPPPETAPVALDRAFGGEFMTIEAWRESRAAKCRTAGIILIGVGLGVGFLITMAGNEPSAGLGVGGMIAILGLAFLACGLVERRYTHPPGTTPPNAPPKGPNRS